MSVVPSTSAPSLSLSFSLSLSVLESSDKSRSWVACIKFPFWVGTDTKRSIIGGFALSRSVVMITVIGRGRSKRKESDLLPKQ